MAPATFDLMVFFILSFPNGVRSSSAMSALRVVPPFMMVNGTQAGFCGVGENICDDDENGCGEDEKTYLVTVTMYMLTANVYVW